MPEIFINYRRSDVAQAAQGLHAQLRSRFGPSKVFLDVGAILPGSLWSDRLQAALDKADVVLSVIGPGWLTAANEFSQRRLDDPLDWVRSEITYAIKHKKPIIPLLVSDVNRLPPAEALPTDIQGLLCHQGLKLRDEKWDRDIAELIDVLISEHGFIDNELAVPLPQPEVRVPALTANQLEAALTFLPGWQPVESSIPRDYPKLRQEVRKVYRFRSFTAAIAFMNAAAAKIIELKHHPRWENQWKTVSVYLTTFDIGNQIAALDVKMAIEFDPLYEQLKV